MVKLKTKPQKTTSDLAERYEKKLAESDLSTADGKQLGFELYAESDLNSFADLSPKVPGFRIPYFDLSGTPTKFWRFRFLYETKTGFARQTTSKSQRYAQASKSLNELYLPPFLDWEAIAKDPAIPIIMTEGELKAACAAKNGLATIGLGGVWCFRSATHGQSILPAFEEITWSGRTVYIIYDSDVSSNAHVIAAENALARALLKLGALVMIGRLPALEEGRKTGLDDFVVERGVDALLPVFETASTYAAAEELHRLNEEVVYVNNPGLVLRLDTMQRMAPRAFVDHAYAPRVFYEQVESPNGTKLVEKSAPKEWIKWAMRSSVEKVAYAPGEKRITEDGELNVWTGWAVDPIPGDVAPWHALLDFLFAGIEPAHRRWFEQWLAYPLQKPGTKLYSAVVLWGLIHGTGKSLIGYTMFKIYGSNATEIGNQDLASNFNEWAENKQFVMGDEIAGGDKRHSADRMKSMITQRQLRLNPKFIPSYTVVDCINYYFTSNHPDAFFLEDSDRRFFIHEVVGKPLAEKFYQAYIRWLEREGGAAALFAYLLALPTDDFNPQGHAPQTSSKQEMIDNGRSDVSAWVATLRVSPESILKVGDVSLLSRKLWTTTELHAIYDPSGHSKVTANGLSREMRRAGFRRVYGGNPVPIDGGAQKLWALGTLPVNSSNGPELAKLYNEERGIRKVNGKAVETKPGPRGPKIGSGRKGTS